MPSASKPSTARPRTPDPLHPPAGTHKRDTQKGHTKRARGSSPVWVSPRCGDSEFEARSRSSVRERVGWPRGPRIREGHGCPQSPLAWIRRPSKTSRGAEASPPFRFPGGEELSFRFFCRGLFTASRGCRFRRHRLGLAGGPAEAQGVQREAKQGTEATRTSLPPTVRLASPSLTSVHPPPPGRQPLASFPLRALVLALPPPLDPHEPRRCQGPSVCPFCVSPLCVPFVCPRVRPWVAGSGAVSWRVRSSAPASRGRSRARRSSCAAAAPSGSRPGSRRTWTESPAAAPR